MESLPSEIPFPKVPYAQQVQLMNQIKTCIENGNVGLFESPTG